MAFPDPLGDGPAAGERGCTVVAALLVAASLAATVYNLLAG